MFMLKKSYKKKLIAALFIALGIAGFSVISAEGVNARDNYRNSKYTGDSEDEEVYYDPSDYQQWKESFKETPVEDAAFRKNKKGCDQKMAFMTILMKKYKDGEGTDGITESPLLSPYMKEQYKQIQEKGVLEAQKSMMLDYQECIKNAEVEEDPGDEYDLNMRYGACNQLNKILMGTVEGIKKRKSIDTVIRRYENNFPDLSETSYGEIEDPVPLLIGQLYKKAGESQGKSEQEKDEALFEHASRLVLMCTM